MLSEKALEQRKHSLALIKKGKFNLLTSLIFKNSIYDQSKYPLFFPLLQAMAREVGAEKYMIQLNAMLNKPDHSMLLSSIECPTLLLASRQDDIMPSERSEYIAKHIKHAKLVYLDACGHLAPLEQPDLLNKVLSDWC